MTDEQPIEKSCWTCDYFLDGDGYEYKESSECHYGEGNMSYLKGFPFKNGCKFYRLSSKFTFTREDAMAMLSCGIVGSPDPVQKSEDTGTEAIKHD